MIEKKIFTYWHSKDLPKLCQICIESWKTYCPGMDIKVLNSQNFQNHIKRPLPKEFYDLKVTKQSNWIRSVLIYEHGGIWMDTSILLTQKIDNWFNYNCDFFGIKDKKRIENWFFGASRNSPLVLEWLQQYEYAISIGPEIYEKETMKLVEWKKWTYLYHQLCFLRACQKLSIDIFNKNDVSNTIKHVNNIGYPISEIKLNFGKKWEYGFMVNAMKLGLKTEKTLPLYKLPKFTRPWAEKALKYKIEAGSPLYLAGYRNNSKSNYEIYIYTAKLYIKSLIWRLVYFLGIKTP